MRYRINWRFVLALTVATAACLTTLHFVHRWQARRLVGALIHQADVARDATPPDMGREVSFLRRYVAARPDDHDARERLSRLLTKTAKTRNESLQAYLAVEETLRRDPGRDDLRLFAIDYAMEDRVGLFAEAIGDIDILLQKRPADGELELKKARCLTRSKKYKEAAGAGGWYERAIQHRPDLIDAYIERAVILRTELKSFEEADKNVARMLEASPKNFRTHLLTAAYWRLAGRLDQDTAVVARDVMAAQNKVAVATRSTPLAADAKLLDAVAKATTEAKALAPNELNVIRADADVSRFRGYNLARAGKPDEAKAAAAESQRILKAGLTRFPQSPALYLSLASLESETKQEKDAVAVIQEGLKAIPDDTTLVIALLDYQLRAGDASGARETLKRLEGKGLSPAQSELQQGRIYMLEGKWLPAAASLDHVRRTYPDRPALVREASLFLGRCCQQLGQMDRRRDAFAQAVPADTTDPLWVPAMLGLAEAELALGKSNEALAVFEQLRGRGLGGAWLPIARIQLAKTMRTPAETRDWSATEQALSTAEKVLPKNTEVRILRATVTSLRGDPSAARKQLEALKNELPKESAVWVALATQDLSDGNPAAALATLDAAVKAAGDSATLRLARARVWISSKALDLDRKLEGLATGIDKLPLPEQQMLLRELAELASGSPGPLSAQLWDRVVALRPDDLGAHLSRFDRALGDDADVAAQEKKLEAIASDIRRIDGEAGASTRFTRAVYLIWRAQARKDLAGLDEAAQLLDGLARERPNWSRIAYSQALLHEVRRDFRAATASYQKAVALGEANPATLRRLMELLRSAGKFDEAALILQRLPKSFTAKPELNRVAADVLLQTNDLAGAEAYADKAVPATSTNPADFIWQGQVYFSAGAKAKAEAAFRKATVLRPSSADGWLVLIQYLVATSRKPEAEKLLEESKAKVEKAERALFLGRAYAVLGKSDKAAESFKQARTERPNDLKSIRAEADFLFQAGKGAAAREAFERVIALQGATAEDKDFARQMIGISLAADSDYATSRQALEKLGLVQGGQLRPLTGNETAAQRRSRIVVLALQRDRASRLEAIRMLEDDLNAGREVIPSDQFLLAQLHQAVGNPARVRVIMSGLLKKHDRSALYVSYYASWLLRAGDTEEAEKWVKRLASLQPDSLATAELQARLAAAKGDLATARKILLPHADGPDAPVLGIARLCEAIKLYEEAETLYKRVVDKVKEKQPEAVLLLAGFYGRRGRTAEGLRVCDDARKTIPAEVVGGVAVGILYESTTPTSTQMSEVAGWLEEAVRKASGETKATLIQHLAAVRNLQGDYAASMKLYADAIAANPRDVLAMNNLAFFVSARDGRHDDALKLLARARELRGPLATFLDTEALVRLNMKDTAGARRLLEEVTAVEPSGSAFFHLAQAELAAGRKLEALGAWRKAKELNVKPADLHPLEREAFKRLQSVLD